MQDGAKLIYKVDLPPETRHGTFVAPQAYELPSLDLITGEVFGPILHVLRYRKRDLDKVIDNINALGYGLTFGIQSRIDETIDHIQNRIHAGNIYVTATPSAPSSVSSLLEGVGCQALAPKPAAHIICLAFALKALSPSIPPPLAVMPV